MRLKSYPGTEERQNYLAEGRMLRNPEVRETMEDILLEELERV